jgi:hypothetical protein
MKFLSAAITLFLIASTNAIACPTMGAAQLYTVMASSTVTSTGATNIAGSVGLYPGSAFVGFPPAMVSGNIQTGSSVAQGAAMTLYNSLLANTCTDIAAELGGQTLAPGVYCIHGAATISSALVLNGGGVATGVWVFIIDTTFIGTAGSAVTLTNGATACNAFFAVGTSATFNSGEMKGNIIAMQAITLTTGAVLAGGRLFALNAAVTLDVNPITTCFCGGTAEPTQAAWSAGTTTINPPGMAPKNSAAGVAISAGIVASSMLVSLLAL